MGWDDYRGMSFHDEGGGVLRITITGRDSVNSLDDADLTELAQVWQDVDRDPAVRVAVVTGEGRYFSAGGNLQAEQRNAGDYQRLVATHAGARALVQNLVNSEKIIVSAINGPAVGAGLVVALLADISIIGEGVRFTDGHVRIGMTAGDHACIVWPLLCGMAKAKWYLLTGEMITGREAAELGLVSKSVPDAEVLDQAREAAASLARSPQLAIRWTKRSLNHWMRNATPAFEASLALEIVNMFGGDYTEGLNAFLEKREPQFSDG